MLTFDPHSYGSATAAVLAGERLCELGPGQPHRDFHDELSALTSNHIVSDATDPEMARCCLSGLWLLHNYLDESHSISQEIHSPCGSYWHGIMHRREPDYSNAKYWYRRIGEHPIYDRLQARVADLGTQSLVDDAAADLAMRSSWDPYAFVDLCSSVARGKSDAKKFCQEVSRAEWELLFDYCFEQAK